MDKESEEQKRQSEIFKAKYAQQNVQIEEMQAQVAQLRQRGEERKLEKAKAIEARREQKEARRKARKEEADQKMKDKLVAQVVERILQKQEAEQQKASQADIVAVNVSDTLALGLDPATRDFIQAQLGDDSSTLSAIADSGTKAGAQAPFSEVNNHSSNIIEDKQKDTVNMAVLTNKKQVKTSDDQQQEVEQVISVDLNRMNTTTNTLVNDEDAENDHANHHTVVSAAVMDESKADMPPQRTEITASEPDEESLTHAKESRNKEDNSTNKGDQKLPPIPIGDLPRQKSRSPVQKVSPFVSYLDQIKLALEKLESYSLRSSEDINDSIEQLVTCFNSNNSALQRALDDLKLQKRAAALKHNSSGNHLREESCSQTSGQSSSVNNNTVLETANKILFQFENFAEYTRGEVRAILSQLDERQVECQASLDQLTKNLIPSHAKQQMQTAQSNTTAAIQFQACKEHVSALKLHIMNTQQFLTRESQQIDLKIGELQLSVVKDIELILQSTQTQADNEADNCRSSTVSLLSSLHQQQRDGAGCADHRTSNASLQQQDSNKSTNNQIQLNSKLNHRQTLSQELPSKLNKKRIQQQVMLSSSYQKQQKQTSNIDVQHVVDYELNNSSALYGRAENKGQQMKGSFVGVAADTEDDQEANDQDNDSSSASIIFSPSTSNNITSVNHNANAMMQHLLELQHRNDIQASTTSHYQYNNHHQHLNNTPGGVNNNIVLKSQISTIPEEEMDTDFGNGLHTDHQSSSNFNGTGTHLNLQSVRHTLGVEDDEDEDDDDGDQDNIQFCKIATQSDSNSAEFEIKKPMKSTSATLLK